MTQGGRIALDSTTFNLRNGSLGLTLRFSGGALTALKGDVGAAFLTSSTGGSETGGILIGDMAQQGSQWAVMVDAVTPVPIEHQYGPSYRLSAGDKQRFRELAHAGDFGSRPIGWYRGNMRPEKDVDEADRQISQTFFSANQSIFLLCEPSPAGTIRATCIIMLPRRTEVAFPFELGEFSALDTLAVRPPEPYSVAKAAAEAPAFTPVVMSAARPESRLPAPPPAPAQTAAAPPVITARHLKVAAAMAAVAVIVWYGRGRLAPQPAPATPPVTASTAVSAAALASPDLGLRAEYKGDSLLLGWDRTSPFIAAAVSGAVTIADGNRTRVVRLSPRDLRGGSILYKPSADDIDVEMDVATASGTTGSQSIRIIGAAPPASRAVAAGADSGVPEAPVRLAPRVIPQPASSQLPHSPSHFQPPPARAQAPRSITTQDPPILALARPTVGTLAPVTAVALPPEPERFVSGGTPPQMQRALQPSTPPSPQSPPSAGMPPVPAAPRRVTDLQPAVVLRSVQPSFPADSGIPPGTLNQAVEVNVEVRIDRRGRVASARLTPDNHPNAAPFAPSALTAARSWSFKPAMLGGRPIESTMIIKFRYSPPGGR